MAKTKILADNHEESNGTAVVVTVSNDFVMAERPDISIENCINHIKEAGLRITRGIISRSTAEVRALDCYKNYHVGDVLVINNKTSYKLENLKKSQIRIDRPSLFNNLKKEYKDITLEVIFIMRDPEEGYMVTFKIVE